MRHNGTGVRTLQRLKDDRNSLSVERIPDYLTKQVSGLSRERKLTGTVSQVELDPDYLTKQVCGALAFHHYGIGEETCS